MFHSLECHGSKTRSDTSCFFKHQYLWVREMKALIERISASILLAGGALSLVSFHSGASSPSTVRHPRRPVVIELFTSEGCSSCPPAEAFLLRLESDQSIEDVEV